MKKIYALSLLVLSSFVTIAQQATEKDATPVEVYRYVNEIANMLERISFEMGIELNDVEDMAVSNVSSREVYFQAATLYSKTAQLMFEFTGAEGEVIDEHKLNPQSSDVYALLPKAQENLLHVLETLGVKWSESAQDNSEDANPKLVFQLVVQLNKKTNQLLDFKFSPAQSHQKVTESIALATAILQTYSGSTAVFYPNPRVAGKMPNEVYQQLVYLYQDLSDVFEKSGKSCLILADSEANRGNVEPSDVYDFAVLIASQLRHFHASLPSQVNVRPSYYPGKVVPSDVYQRLTILQQQINELKRLNQLGKLVN